MTKKFHIDLNGKPAPCNAKQHCPRGGSDEHFPTTEKALEYADYINELKIESESELQAYYSGNLSTDEIGTSKNPLVRIEAYNNGYESPNILNEDYLVKKKLLANGLYTEKLIADTDDYISETALKFYNKENNTNLNYNNIDNFIGEKQKELDKAPENEELRTEIAYLNRMKNKSGEFSMSSDELFNNISEPDGGATFNPVSGKIPSSGFCYSPYPELSKTIDVQDPISFQDGLNNYFKENKEILNQNGHYIGLWNDPATGVVYLDISVNSMEAKEVRKGCEQKDQIAYFDLQTFESVTVNQNATSGQSDDFKNNMKELEQQGVFSEELSNKIKNTSDEELERMAEYFKNNND